MEEHNGADPECTRIITQLFKSQEFLKPAGKDEGSRGTQLTLERSHWYQVKPDKELSPMPIGLGFPIKGQAAQCHRSMSGGDPQRPIQPRKMKLIRSAALFPPLDQTHRDQLSTGFLIYGPLYKKGLGTQHSLSYDIESGLPSMEMWLICYSR
ncbi:hypothetical protein NQZ68_002382 [Dissostichus eleginoides]|nr:hypothetical protein NQZ68_002382 [Dissostichus eleginoides]